jgi:hypothetical protein
MYSLTYGGVIHSVSDRLMSSVTALSGGSFLYLAMYAARNRSVTVMPLFLQCSTMRRCIVSPWHPCAVDGVVLTVHLFRFVAVGSDDKAADRALFVLCHSVDDDELDVTLWAFHGCVSPVGIDRSGSNGSTLALQCGCRGSRLRVCRSTRSPRRQGASA